MKTNEISDKSKTSAIRHQYKPLTADEVQQIHETSMRVLEEVGFEVQEEEAFALFEKAGAMVDHETRVVRIKEPQVTDLISTAPTQVTLCGRSEEHDCTLGAGNVYFATGGTALNILDWDSGECRPAQLQDLVDVVRLVDQLKNIHAMLLPTYPNELPVEDVDVNRFFAGLCFTDKHIMGGIYTSQGIDDVIAMAEKIAGSAQALKERPFISMIACGISPLRFDSKYGAYMIKLAKKGIPAAVPVEPLCGATSPVTLAGTLVIQNCDSLINVMVTQMASAGAPVIYGSVATSVNLHDVSYLGGPVESGMLNAATAQLAQYYGFPYYSTAGISDSKTLDNQCGYETAVNNMLVAMAGGDFIHYSAGLMEFATTVSKEKLVIDNEILGMVNRAVKGIDVNEQTLAFDAIKAAGPGGNFVTNRHTRRFMHKEHYYPTLSDRQKRELWVEAGSKRAAARANDTVTELLGQEPHYYLEKSLRQELQEMFGNIQG